MSYPVLNIATKALASALSLVLMSGCQTLQPIDTVENGGDSTPLMTSSAVRSGDYSNLESGEAVALAYGTDGAVARPNAVTVTVYESVQSVEERALEVRDCDLDDDGIDDIVCQSDRAQAGDEERAPFFALAGYKYVFNEHQQAWFPNTWVNADKLEGSTYQLRFRLIFMNSGSKVFRGRVKAVDHLPQSLKFKSLDQTAMVVDQRDLKMGLSMIPFVQLVAIGMDNFAVRDALPARLQQQGQLINFETAEEVVLQPQQGVMFEFSAIYTLPFGDLTASADAPRPAAAQPSAEDQQEHTRGEVVLKVQKALNRLGFDAGPEDGFIGNRTRNAIRQYQISKGLPEDGRATRLLLQHLER